MMHTKMVLLRTCTDACYVRRDVCDKRVSKTDGEQKENNRETVSRSCNPKLEILLWVPGLICHL